MTMMMTMKTPVAEMVMNIVGVEMIMTMIMSTESRTVGLEMNMNIKQSIIIFHIARNTRNSYKLASNSHFFS